jgi:cytochrome P450
MAMDASGWFERRALVDPSLLDPKLHTVPGPLPMRGLGTLPRLIAFGRDPIGTAGRLFARYGPIASIVRGPARMVCPTGRGVVLATGAEINREVLTQHDRYHMYALPGVFYPEEAMLERAASRKRFSAGPHVDRLRPVRRTLTGLFHVNGNEHRRHRRLLMPAFHKTRIDAYCEEMVRITNAVLDGWREGETRDVLEDMTRTTLRIATTTLFGEDVGERGVTLAKLMQEWLITMMKPSMIARLDLPRTAYRRWLDLTSSIDERTVEIVREKRARMERARGEVGRDMLSMLLAARDEDGSALDEDELIGHTGVIFAAGHETSTNALAWTLLLLSEHPEIASDLCEELASVLRGGPPTVASLAKLPLLDAVVKESLRVLPPVPLHPRIVAEDHELQGHLLPRRTELMLSIFHMHHDPEVFSEPRRFLPSRWSTIKPTTFEYNPFSAGPRMCIGATFATMEIKIVLATLLQRFRVGLAPNARIDRRVAITMAPKFGMPMRICRADNDWRRGAGALTRGDIRELVQFS